MSIISIFDKDNSISLDGLINAIQSADTPTSLTEFAKQSMINSRVYIEKNLATDEILTPLMQNIMSLYCGLVFTAVNLNQNICGSKTVRDISSTVSSAEAFDARQKSNTFDSAMSLMKDYFVGSNKDPMVNRPYVSMSRNSNHRNNNNNNNSNPNNSNDIHNNTYHGHTVQNLNPVNINNNNSDNRNLSTSVKYDMKPASIIDPDPKSVNLPSGRILSIPMLTDSNSMFNLQLLIQLFPFFIETDVAQEFINLNFTPSFWRRFTQFQAGEISFFKDFIFSCDLREKRMKALIKDKTGGLADMINKQKNAVASHWMNFLRKPGTEKINIASTILILNKNSVDKALNKNGIDLKSSSNRKKFFENSYCMMLVVVDQMYNEVNIYYNGIEAVSTFKYEQIKRESKKDSTDLVSIMKSYAQGLAPKF